MLVITRIFWFIDAAVMGLILAVILLMAFRLIADFADLNPFSWTSRTIRRLSDPFNTPVRRSLISMGVDSKYSPLVVLLIAILLGWFALQLSDALKTTTAGLLLSVTRGAPVVAVGFVIYGLLSVYTLLVFMRIIFSWGQVSYKNRLMRFLVNTTEPLLGPLRRMIPPLGMFDISPIVAFFILYLFQAAVAGTLLRGAM